MSDEQNRRGGFPPVGYLWPLEPWESIQQIPGAPHNLSGDRPGFKPFSPASSPFPSGVPSGGPLASPVDNVVSDPHHYADLITGNVPVGIVSAVPPFLTASSNKRNFLAFRNSSAAANIYINFGTIADLNSWLRLIPNATAIFDDVVPQNDIYAFADAGAGTLSYAYSTIVI